MPQISHALKIFGISKLYDQGWTLPVRLQRNQSLAVTAYTYSEVWALIAGLQKSRTSAAAL